MECIDLTVSSDEEDDDEERDDCLGNAAAEVKALRVLRAECRAREERWRDPEFPASNKSIVGDEDEERKKDEQAQQRREDARRTKETDSAPTCRCGREAATATVTTPTSPNVGQTYYKCATRDCAFFAWTDGRTERNFQRARLHWERPPPDRRLTGADGRYAATDLRQGSLGDCWFISAVAVVSERRDLVERLFVVDDASAEGAYACRLFLDGAWTVVRVDDQFPHTAKGPAYVRCVSSTSGKPTLWASLLEKCYAKAHGSFRAISGGQISEALRDLTGANTISIDIPRGDFRKLEDLWHTLFRWKNVHHLPCGVATSSASDPQLHGNHAYSVLAVKSYDLPGGQRCRLVRVRDPHGLSQFPVVDLALVRPVVDELSSGRHRDAHLDAHDQQLIADVAQSSSSFGNDQREAGGTFWIEYARFAAAFSRLDVALAYEPGKFYAQSVPRFFPPSKGPTATRACADGHPVILRSKAAVELSVGAIQPTTRGAKAREDRKKSYKCGDVSVVVADADSGRTLASCFYGAEVGGVEFVCCCRLARGQRVAVFCYSLGKNPTAAATTSKQPFTLRLCASGPLVVQEERESGVSPCLALHAALASSVDVSRPRTRRWITLTETVRCLVVEGDGVVAVVAVNDDAENVVGVEATVFCKSAVARCSDDAGLLDDDTARANAYSQARQAVPKSSSSSERQNNSFSFRWPAKWKCFRAASRVPAGRRRLVLVVARSGVQWRVGDVECRLLAAPPNTQQKVQTRIDAFGGKDKDGGTAAALMSAVFAPVFLDAPPPRAKKKRRVVQQDEDDDLRRAIADSLRRDDTDDRAVELSTDDADLARALELSRQEEEAKRHQGGSLADEDDDELQRAIELSRRHHQDVAMTDDPPMSSHPRPTGGDSDASNSAESRRQRMADALKQRGL